MASDGSRVPPGPRERLLSVYGKAGEGIPTAVCLHRAGGYAHCSGALVAKVETAPKTDAKIRTFRPPVAQNAVREHWFAPAEIVQSLMDKGAVGERFIARKSPRAGQR